MFPWSQCILFLNGIATPILHRKPLPSSPPEFLDEVFVPQVGDVVPNFRSGHAKARSKRDPDPIKQLIDDSISIIRFNGHLPVSSCVMSL